MKREQLPVRISVCVLTNPLVFHSNSESVCEGQFLCTCSHRWPVTLLLHLLQSGLQLPIILIQISPERSTLSRSPPREATAKRVINCILFQSGTVAPPALARVSLFPPTLVY